MSDTIKIILNGYNGKMGKVICDMVEKDADIQIVAGIDTHETQSTFPVFTDINKCDLDADVIIDFSVANATDKIIDYAVKREMPLVICTTGLFEDTLLNIEKASKKIAIFKSANMSLGINLVANLIKKAVNILGENGFDIEIIEKHHNQKIDAPSGTALLLADSINDEVANKYNYVYDRSKVREKRNDKEIGISSIRGGNIVGEHSVIFAGKDETIEFTHIANSKEIFAVGAVKASKFIKNKKSGVYDMQSIMEKL